jgi:hypothetical protein
MAETEPQIKGGVYRIDTDQNLSTSASRSAGMD